MYDYTFDMQSSPGCLNNVTHMFVIIISNAIRKLWNEVSTVLCTHLSGIVNAHFGKCILSGCVAIIGNTFLAYY